MSCTADTESGSGLTIRAQIEPLLPANATPANPRFSYSFDPNMGFLGGPSTPLVTAELINLDFEFVTPLSGLAAIAGASNAGGLGGTSEFPSMSAALPAEALGRTRPEQTR